MLASCWPSDEHIPTLFHKCGDILVRNVQYYSSVSTVNVMNSQCSHALDIKYITVLHGCPECRYMYVSVVIVDR